MIPSFRQEYGEQGYNSAQLNIQDLETGTGILSLAYSIFNIMILLVKVHAMQVTKLLLQK